MQYNRVWRLGLSYRESAKWEYFPLILVGGFPDAFPDVTDDQSDRSGGHGFFCTAGEGGDPTILYNITRVWVKWFIF